MRLQWIAGLLILGLALTACDSDDTEAETAEEPTEEAAVDEVEESGDVGEGAAVGEPTMVEMEGPFEGAHDPEEPIEAEDFPGAMAEGVCLAYDHCVNEELKSMLISMLVMGAAMNASTEGDEETEARLEEMMEQMQAEGHIVADRDTCDEIMGLTLSAQNLDADNIAAGMEAGRLEYDADRAAQCVAVFGQPFDLCREERVATAQPDQQEFMASVMRHQDNLATHFSACDNVFMGQLEDGDECFMDLECADGECVMDADADSGECGQPEMPEPGMMPGGGAPGGGAPGGAPGGQQMPGMP